MPSSSAPHSPRRGPLAALALLGAAGLAACGGGVDPFAPRAQYETVRDTFAVYALSSGQTALPAALDLFAVRAVRPSLGGGSLPNFDFAFERSAQGQVVLYPARLLGSPSGGSPRVGFQVATAGFDALESAPRNGYRYDSTQVVRVGETIVIESQGVTGASFACGTSTPLYAKLVVDSVGAAGGAIGVRVHVNPNCGFRSFAAGLPTN